MLRVVLIRYGQLLANSSVSGSILSVSCRTINQLAVHPPAERSCLAQLCYWLQTLLRSPGWPSINTRTASLQSTELTCQDVVGSATLLHFCSSSLPVWNLNYVPVSSENLNARPVIKPLHQGKLELVFIDFVTY